MTLRFAPGAREDIVLAQTWWRENRPDAPELMGEALREAFLGLADHAHALPRFRMIGGLEVRRVLVARVHRHVYLRVAGPDDTVVLAVWGAVRGLLPRLQVRLRESR